ncbi:MAG TPA: rhodanese-like domain-containing protein [Gemmatimonadaceae bacterium]|nr:rhodanese-like domain-containing protein [Gemmatimonadaceae bacterium]
MTAPRGRWLHWGLATAALALGVLAAVSGDASSRVVAPESEVTALELARWIREGKRDLRVIDLRDAESFAGFSIPSAERISLEDLARVPWDRQVKVVVYADSAPLAWRAREVLDAVGVRDALVLRDGLAGWVTTIASPVLPAHPSPEQERASREIAEMSRWFGGVPRVGEPQVTASDSLRAALGRIRRRGC